MRFLSQAFNNSQAYQAKKNYQNKPKDEFQGMFVEHGHSFILAYIIS